MKVSDNYIAIPPGDSLGEFLNWVWFSPFGYMLNQLLGFNWYFIIFWTKFWKSKLGK